MTLMPRFALLALTTGISISIGSIIMPACNGDDEASSVQDYLAGVDGFTRNVCACEFGNPFVLVPLGKIAYGSSEACLMDLPPSAAERGCTEGLFQDQTVDYGAVLECRAEALDRSDDCLRAKTCTDTARTGCYTTLDDEIKSCPDLPDDVEAKLIDCLYN